MDKETTDRPHADRNPRWWIGGLLAVGLFFLTSPAEAQVFEDILSTPIPGGEGWAGFSDSSFLLSAFLNLVLAAALGAAIGYHPRRVRTADTLLEIEAPKVSILYAVMGSLIGILVVQYGMGVGFVLFGIGGLTRFRTTLRSAQLTGQVILATLIGLTCGLELPHVAVLATAFDFVLTFFLEARITYRVDVRGIPMDRFVEAEEAYRTVLSSGPYTMLTEIKRPEKGRLSFVFRGTGRGNRQRIQDLLNETVAPELQGSLNWELD